MPGFGEKDMAHKRIYLIRHGKTPGNTQRRYIGRGTDEALSAEGIEEAGRCRLRMASIQDFRDEKLRVCASPMIRTLQTARILFDRPVTVISAIEEIDFGAFEGKDEKELSQLPSWQAWIDRGCTGQIPGGESLDQFIDRSYAGFLEALGDRTRDETIAVVCHGGTIMSVMEAFAETRQEYYKWYAENGHGYMAEWDGSVLSKIQAV